LGIAVRASPDSRKNNQTVQLKVKREYQIYVGDTISPDEAKKVCGEIKEIADWFRGSFTQEKDKFEKYLRLN